MQQLTREEIDEIFYRLKIPEKIINPKRFEVWEVPPIKRDMHLYSSSD